MPAVARRRTRAAAVRRAERLRLWTLIAAGLLSHSRLDAGNSYGVHPFFPFDSRWYYGDAVFILEPWLWLLLGVPVPRGWRRVRRRAWPSWRWSRSCPSASRVRGWCPAGAVAALVATGLVFGWGLSRLAPRARALTAIAASVAFVGVLFGLSRVARGEVKALLAPAVRGEILDVVLTPDPANPVCWSVIVDREGYGRASTCCAAGTLSLVPAWLPPTTCASHRYGGPRPYREVGGRLARYDDIRQPLETLRALGDRDCCGQGLAAVRTRAGGAGRGDPRPSLRSGRGQLHGDAPEASAGGGDLPAAPDALGPAAGGPAPAVAAPRVPGRTAKGSATDT